MQTDRLEPRVLFSAPAVSLREGVLYVHATDANPVVLTVGYADSAKARIRVTAAGATLGKTFRASAVQRVILEGGAGGDSLSIDSSLARFDKEALILGGAGDDTLAGGFGDDALLGGAGDDDLAGGRGHDLLLGGADDDTLLGGTGNDVCFGGLGSDQVDGGAGDDILFSLRGPDTVAGGAGKDTITVGESGRADGGLDDDSIWVVSASTATVLGGGGNNQTFPITSGKAGRRLKRQIAADVESYHLTTSALRQV